MTILWNETLVKYVMFTGICYLLEVLKFGDCLGFVVVSEVSGMFVDRSVFGGILDVDG